MNWQIGNEVIISYENDIFIGDVLAKISKIENQVITIKEKGDFKYCNQFDLEGKSLPRNYKFEGKEYKTHYGEESIRLATQEDKDIIKRRDSLYLIKTFKLWGVLDMDEIEQVAKIIRKHQRR
jgi:hypothetical protein